MAATGLLRLGRLTGDAGMVQRAHRVMLASLPLLKRAPNAGSQMLVAIDSWLNDDRQFVLARSTDEEQNRQAIDLLQKHVSLSETLIVFDPAVSGGPLENVQQGKTADTDEPVLYICREFACQNPVSGIEAIGKALSPLVP